MNAARALWDGARPKLLGLAFIVVVFSLLALSVAMYDKAFTPVVKVTLDTDRTGNELALDSDVKLRGIEIGTVRGIKVTPTGGAALTLALDPSKVGLVPSDVQAQILPKTLFGEKFVDLVPPAGQTPGAAMTAIKAGDVIPQDRSAVATEVNQVFDNLVPLLQAVQPAKLNETLTAVATALRGRGNELGDLLTKLDSYTKGINPALPQLDTDISGLADLGTTYTAALPSVLKTLDNLNFTSQTLVAKKADLTALLKTGDSAVVTLTQTLNDNEADLIHVTTSSAPVLDTLRDYGQQLPSLLQALTDLTPKVNAALGGKQGPYLHINLSLVPDRGAYTIAGGDCPQYPDGAKGPNCPGGGSAGSSSQNTAASGQQSALRSTQPGTKAEAEQVDELVGAASGQQPSTIGAMGDILFAPLLRGTQVNLS
jgi:phospholipid/cholesterol/gamma-HCH transport system substrate-binding protein